MTDEDRGFAEGKTEESGDQLAQSLTPDPAEFPEQPGPQTLIPEHGALPAQPAQSLVAEPGELPEQPGAQTLIPERGELSEQPDESRP